MLILHAGWLPADAETPGRLFLWAESDAPARRAAARSGAASTHPNGAATTALRLALAPAAAGLLDSAADAVAVALLPTVAGLPVASPEAGLAPAAGEAELTRWSLRGLEIEASSAAALLVSLASLSEQAHEGGAIAGADLQFWQQAALFALSLVARQRLLPDLRLENAAFSARWRPQLEHTDDAARLRTLAAAMPPAARAITRTAAGTPAGPITTLRAFIESVVDGVARRALAGEPRADAGALPAQAWLSALCGDGRVQGRPPELAALRQLFQRWAGAAGAAMGAGSTFRLSFRLEPPLDLPLFDDQANPRRPDTPPPWTLAFLLQATDDPSLVVPAGEVWRQHGSTATFLERRFDRPQERVLAALGHAARLFQPIERSLHSRAPEACDLDIDEAYRFVREGGPLLAESGFGVLLPGMENRLGLRLRLSTPSTSTGSSGPAVFTRESLVAFDWQVALGDETISAEEFEALAALKTPLVQVRGRWIELRPEVIERTLGMLRRHAERRDLSLDEALRIALAPEEALPLPVQQIEAEGAFGDLLERITHGAAHDELVEPEGFEGQLRPYQRTGLSWLHTLRGFGLGACLADDMGLGKTVQVIALLLHRRAQQPDSGPALLICPTSVVANWRHELERFAPALRVLIHHGANRNRATFVAEAAEYDIVVSSYALLHRDAELLTAVSWAEVVLDEAQNIKNPGTLAARTASSLDAGWRAALTGTPVENRLSDLWSIFRFLNPGLLGSAEQFRRTFSTPIERTGDAQAAERLQRLVSPFILRRLKSDRSIIADLPEKNEMKVFCSLTGEQATLYKAVLSEALDAMEESEGMQRRGQVLAMLTKLKQVCNHPSLLLHDGSRLEGRSGKLARLTEMLEEVVSEGDRALIFTQYAEMGKLLQQHLSEVLGQEAIFLHGGTSAAARERMVQRFQQEQHGPKLFVLSIKAGGTGLNLTRANHVFHFDRWWNPAVENQATDRAFRIGQRRNVQVHKYLCAGTFEEQLDQVLERKLALAESIVGTSESWISELSQVELRELFSLRPEAVSGA